MNDLRERYFSIEQSLFPMVEEEFGELTSKMKEFLRIVELVQPGRFINAALRWCGLGRPMANRESMLRAFFLKAISVNRQLKLLNVPASSYYYKGRWESGFYHCDNRPVQPESFCVQCREYNGHRTGCRRGLYHPGRKLFRRFYTNL